MLRFWNNHENAQLLNLAGSGTGGGGGGERWWSVEELGQGASVVRSKGDGSDREVWVLKVGESPEGQSLSPWLLFHIYCHPFPSLRHEDM